MILTLASAIYGAVATRRRQWYVRHPERVRRLQQPVISIGNLSVGGSGKTPVVASLARVLQDRGERPSILSRGYARGGDDKAVVVVSDMSRVLVDVERAGDEPFMLATALPGVPIVVHAERYEAGRTAEESLGVTIHVLDDGFQHMGLWRDVNVLIVDATDVRDRVLPAGRLREPLTAAAAADVVLTPSADGAADDVRRAMPSRPLFSFERRLGLPHILEGVGPLDLSAPVFLLAGIARPARFAHDVTAAGWRVAGARWFGDHHWFSAADRASVARDALASGTRVILTTEKDAVRLGGVFGNELTVASLPLTAAVDPAFTHWLVDQLDRRSARPQ